MPRIANSSQKTVPTLQGSAPVSEVLGRIQVRDPSHIPNGIYGRRLSDYENHWPLAAIALGITLAAMVGVFVSSPIMQMRSRKPHEASSVPVNAPASPTPALKVPEGVHPVPDAFRSAASHPQPPALAQETETAPSSISVNSDSISVRFLEPRTLELEWDSLGPGYVYQLYAASTPGFQDAQPIWDHPIPASQAIWQPQDGIQNVWLSVKGISPGGQETTFSRPLLVQLPTY